MCVLIVDGWAGAAVPAPPPALSRTTHRRRTIMAEQPTIMDRDDILSGLAQWFHSQWDEGHYLEYETNALICSYEEEHEGAAAELAGTIVKAVESGDEDFKKFLAHLYARKFWKMDKPRTSTPVPGLF